MIHQYQTQILEKHLDTFGHVNNATYFTLFEEARWDLITGRNFGLTVIQKSGLGPVILEAHIKYLSELKNRDLITIETELVEYPGKIGKLKQVIKKSDSQIAAEVIFTFGLFDTKARKLVVPTPEWKFAVGLN